MEKEIIRKLITKHLENGEVNQASRQSYADDDRISGSLLLKIEELIKDLVQLNPMTELGAFIYGSKVLIHFPSNKEGLIPEYREIIDKIDENENKIKEK